MRAIHFGLAAAVLLFAAPAPSQDAIDRCPAGDAGCNSFGSTTRYLTNKTTQTVKDGLGKALQGKVNESRATFLKGAKECADCVRDYIPNFERDDSSLRD